MYPSLGVTRWSWTLGGGDGPAWRVMTNTENTTITQSQRGPGHDFAQRLSQRDDSPQSVGVLGVSKCVTVRPQGLSSHLQHLQAGFVFVLMSWCPLELGRVLAAFCCLPFYKFSRALNEEKRLVDVMHIHVRMVQGLYPLTLAALLIYSNMTGSSLSQYPIPAHIFSTAVISLW